MGGWMGVIMIWMRKMLFIFTIHVVLTIILHGVLYETGSNHQYIIYPKHRMTFVVFPQWGWRLVTVHHYSGVSSSRWCIIIYYYRVALKMYLLTCYHRLPEKSIKSDDILFIFVIINHRQHQKHRKRYYLFSIFF